LNLHSAPRTTAWSAILLCLGLLSGAANCQAGEGDAAADDLAPVQAVALAFAAPFDLLPSGPQSPEPFGAATSAPVSGGLQSKWNMVKKKLPRQHQVLMRCRAGVAGCAPAAKRFLAILERAQAQEGWARIAEINRAINLNIRPVDDITQYGVADFWATPLVTFSSGAGDCEDYAIAKYVALHEIGMDDDDLRLVVVHDRVTGEDHAVAAVRYDGHWLILDNRTLEMRQDVDIAGFEPLFVIDREGVKRMAASAPKPANLMVSTGPAAIELQFSSVWPAAPQLL
jgi:predicted transglutaminase-like cysteine proteinase